MGGGIMSRRTDRLPDLARLSAQTVQTQAKRNPSNALLFVILFSLL